MSDVAYHELSSVSKYLPPLYNIKRARLSINSTLDLNRFTGPFPSAYRPVLAALERELSKAVSIQLKIAVL